MLGPLNAANHPLSECTADEITKYIIENLKPGEKLPNEAELGQVLCVSRTTIREAIKILASRNIVTIVRGVGTFVSKTPGVSDDPFGFRFMQDKNRLALELIQLTSFIEPHLARLAAENATDEETGRLVALEQRIEQSEPGSPEYYTLVVELHTTIANSSHNKVVSLVLPLLIQEITSEQSLYDDGIPDNQSLDYKELVQSILDHDPDKASETMTNHLEKIRQMILSRKG